jgi:hypothetical protein
MRNKKCNIHTYIYIYIYIFDFVFFSVIVSITSLHRPGCEVNTLMNVSGLKCLSIDNVHKTLILVIHCIPNEIDAQ